MGSVLDEPEISFRGVNLDSPAKNQSNVKEAFGEMDPAVAKVLAAQRSSMHPDDVTSSSGVYASGVYPVSACWEQAAPLAAKQPCVNGMRPMLVRTRRWKQGISASSSARKPLHGRDVCGSRDSWCFRNSVSASRGPERERVDALIMHCDETRYTRSPHGGKGHFRRRLGFP